MPGWWPPLWKILATPLIRLIKSYWLCSYRYYTAISQWRQPQADRLWTRRGKRRHYHSWRLQLASTNKSPGYKRIFWQRWKAFGGMPQYYVGKVISVLPLGVGWVFYRPRSYWEWRLICKWNGWLRRLSESPQIDSNLWPFSLYQMAFRPARKPYRIWLLFSQHT